MSGSNPTLIDLFCGAGGISLGFQRAGFRALQALDNWPPAVDTYRLNIGDHVRRCDLSENTELVDADVIVGGPPCQGFSSAGMRRDDDRRNTLVQVFATLVRRVLPRVFVFENVEGFLTGARGQFVLDLLEPLIEAGYRIHVRKVNAANFGVPQHRKRVIVIGGRGFDPSFPEPTHSAYGAPGAHLAGIHLPLTPSLGDGLAGLPPALPASDAVQDDHTYFPLGEDDLERAGLLAPGQCMKDLPEHLWHASYKRRAYRRVRDGTPTHRRGGPPAGMRRLGWDEPSKAITGGAQGEFLHPREDRPLTIRECARLQTFPDSFRFAASRRDAVQLIGNAVPPLLAERIATRLRADLAAASGTRQRGALLTFVPTLSAGMSPILAEVVERVLTRFELKGEFSQLKMEWA